MKLHRLFYFFKSILICILCLTIPSLAVDNKEHPVLLIKIPTRERPHKLFKTLDTLQNLSSKENPLHFLITCDSDDISMNNIHVINRLKSYPNLSFSFNNNLSKVEAYNRDLELYDFDILLAASDDLEPVVKNYDKIIVETMLKNFPDLDGVLNFSDGHVGAACNTYPIVGKNFYKKFNYLYHPSYKSLFANEELTLVSRLLGKEFTSNTVILRHNHPVWGLGDWDNLYYRNEALKEHDRAIFKARRSANFFIPASHLNSTSSTETPLYFCTAADSKYFNMLLIAIGSIHATNFAHLGGIAVANIGLTEEEVKLLNTIEKVTVLEVERVHPDIIKQVTVNQYAKMVPGWYAWKPVVIKQALELFPYVLWIDSTTLILKPLDNLFEYLKAEGNFLATIGDETINGQLMHPVSWSATQKVVDAFNLNNPENSWILSQELLLSTTFGVSREGSDKVLTPLYELSKKLDLYEDDGTTPNGFGTGRHDQTLLSILAYKEKLSILKQDYTQQLPMYLTLRDQTKAPLYITWHNIYVNEKTSIFNARGNAIQYSHYAESIIYKNT